MQSYKTETIGKINSVMSHNLDVEFTIWGASTAYVNFNPQIIMDSLGYSTMNMGIDGTNIDQYYGLLKEYLSYTNNSKYLVIAVDIHGGISDRKSFYHLHNWLHHLGNDNIYNCLSDIDKTLIFKSRYIPFYSLTLYDKHSFPFFRKAIFNNENEYKFNNYGFKQNGDNWIDTDNYSLDALLINVSIGEKTIKKIRLSCLEAIEKKITPIIVITPFYEKGLDKIENRFEVIDLLTSIKNKKIKLFDFSNNYISKNPKYFKDNTHLNKSGADELTRLLVKKIKSN